MRDIRTKRNHYKEPEEQRTNRLNKTPRQVASQWTQSAQVCLQELEFILKRI